MPQGITPQHAHYLIQKGNCSLPNNTVYSILVVLRESTVGIDNWPLFHGAKLFSSL